MRLRLALVALPLFGTAALAPAQTSQPSTPTAEQRLDQFERRLDAIQRAHEADLKARDAEIAALRQELDRLRQNREAAPAAVASNPPAAPADPIEQGRQDVLRDIETGRDAPATPRTPASFNPSLAVVSDFRGSVSSDNANPARNRFDLGAIELDLRAAVDPRADAVAIFPLVRDVEDVLFFNKNDIASDAGEVNTGIEIEEAYLFLHDFGVPNLTAKLGRFHLRYGRQNLLHGHDWPTVDNNFVNQSFLGPEALSDSGVSLSYVIPPKLVGGHYVEAIAEVITGEGSEEATVLNNSAFIDGPALNTHLLWNRDIARDWNLEVGGSWLTGKRNDDNQQSANLFGADVTLVRTDPTGRFNNQLFQAEATYGIVDTSRDETQNAWGFYVLAQQQISRDLYVGARFDWTENALDDQQEVWGISPYLSWYWSEFLRFRVEYQHKDGDVTPEDTLFFQATWIFGAHPPHPYWSMR